MCFIRYPVKFGCNKFSRSGDTAYYVKSKKCETCYLFSQYWAGYSDMNSFGICISYLILIRVNLAAIGPGVPEI